MQLYNLTSVAGYARWATSYRVAVRPWPYTLCKIDLSFPHRVSHLMQHQTMDKFFGFKPMSALATSVMSVSHYRRISVA